MRFQQQMKTLIFFLKSINEINKTNNLKNDDELSSENPIINCEYIDIESFNHKEKTSNIPIIHLNIASLSKHKEEFETLLNSLNFKFDILGISESKLKKELIQYLMLILKDITISVLLPNRIMEGHYCIYLILYNASQGKTYYILIILYISPNNLNQLSLRL